MTWEDMSTDERRAWSRRKKMDKQYVVLARQDEVWRAKIHELGLEHERALAEWQRATDTFVSDGTEVSSWFEPGPKPVRPSGPEHPSAGWTDSERDLLKHGPEMSTRLIEAEYYEKRRIKERKARHLAKFFDELRVAREADPDRYELARKRYPTEVAQFERYERQQTREAPPNLFDLDLARPNPRHRQ